jgi:hypothetical protein
VGGWGVADGMLVRCFLWYLGVGVRWSGKKDGMGWMVWVFGLGWFELSCLISLTTLENSIPPLCMSGFFFRDTVIQPASRPARDKLIRRF